VPNRERKRLLACIIEDATLIKSPEDGTTKVHMRFKGGKTETLTTLNPKSSAQQVKTQPKLVDLVDKLLDDHIYSEIADLLRGATSMRLRTRLRNSWAWESRHRRVMVPVRVLIGLWLLALTTILYGYDVGGWWGVLLVPAAALHFYVAYRNLRHRVES